MRVDFANSEEIDGKKKLYRLKSKTKKKELERATRIRFYVRLKKCLRSR